ncbi:MAG: prepilin-type N-terminal cleavage/methylation domain-containing protein [Pseudomonadales bacterium]|nr:prepilin-type N-terminal cleavage/methylation domain-containing protein [Pseudomonadales bacterium]
MARLRSKNSAESREAGFTLIEVLISFAILGLSLAIMLPAISVHASRSSKILNSTIAQSKLLSLVAQIGQTINVDDDRHSGIDKDGFRWSVEFDPYGDPQDQRAWSVPAYNVTTRIHWDELGEERSLEQKSLMIIPQVGDNGYR